eukprot:SAG11_NODE_203_length_12529_cov_6.036444_15_plen_51_part_00
MTRFTSIERYQEAAVLLFGVLSAGAGTVAQVRTFCVHKATAAVAADIAAA